jgi:hypothetical protein
LVEDDRVVSDCSDARLSALPRRHQSQLHL